MSVTVGQCLLDPSDELLFRQIRGTPTYIEDGVLTSVAFKPLPKDNGELSVDLESLTSAQKCFEEFKANGGDTVGVWAVTTKECKDVGLDSYHQPKITPPPNPSHGYVDFKPLPKDKDRKKKAVLLAERAMARGRVYPPPEVHPQASAEPPPNSPLPPPEPTQARGEGSPHT